MSSIDVLGVGLSYGRTEVLKGIDLSIEAGSVVCLIGASGSGKSTLLRLMNGLLLPDKGHVLVGSELVCRKVRRGRLYPMSLGEVRRQRKNIGMVFQHFELFPHMTAIDNLCLAPTLHREMSHTAARERARQLLARVGLADKADRYPGQLSGGQQQRVAIARALMLNPTVMLFDEPTSALDPELVGEVLLVIRELARDGMTMVIVTHEIGFARDVADRVVFLDGGAILEDGPPAQVLLSPRSERLRTFLSRS